MSEIDRLNILAVWKFQVNSSKPLLYARVNAKMVTES